MTVLAQSFPLLALIVLGFLIKQARLVRAEDGHSLVRVIVNTTLPALVLSSLSQARVEPGRLFLLAACGAVIPILLHRVAIVITQRMGLCREVGGVVVLSTLASSVGLFMAPFFLAFYGREGLSLLAAFDFGNSVIANSYGYYVAMRYGDRPSWSKWQAIRRVAASPLIWANVIGIGLNLSHLPLPGLAGGVLDLLAGANAPLSMLTLGVFIELRFPDWRAMLTAVGLRMGLGWVLGQALVWIVGFTGLERTVVSIGAATPIGVLVLIYASLERLNVEFSAATLSLSILIGMVLTPVLLSIY